MFRKVDIFLMTCASNFSIPSKNMGKLNIIVHASTEYDPDTAILIIERILILLFEVLFIYLFLVQQAACETFPPMAG